MRQRAGFRLWTLILALALMTSGAVTMPGTIWADEVSDPVPAPGPETGTGDPDWPDSGRAKSPKPSPSLGAGGPVTYERISMRSPLMVKWMWSFRMALSSVYRGFFRF